VKIPYAAGAQLAAIEEWPRQKFVQSVQERVRKGSSPRSTMGSHDRAGSK